ncbi:4Fe-4S dicluster domain-containing protein [Geomesophilobacter sediminis]|uniref:4Fe-4S dicluster domain-containing protein n=1 Tax=Geomesophilobacter sediminis TaxID=2798584 RepID=A0A8J7LW01_9BACT|nr:4Fe-4S dicluster domain-containing protein [Geomesophilobacter sediminis]MBJ6726164.1 4Fe-4S dicluster domain-containing protein [Geomesophilobacter sediminis]
MTFAISQTNLRLLVDQLIQDGIFVVGPRRSGSMVLYEPLSKGEALTLDALPRRSAKELFFPVCEDILTYERVEGKMAVRDVDRAHYPETVLVGAPPCDAASPAILDSVFSWDYLDDFYLERRKKTTIIGMGCTRGDDACFCSAVGLAPDSVAGSDLFLTPLPGDEYACQVITEKGRSLTADYPGLFHEQSPVDPLPAPKQEMKQLNLERIKNWLDTHFDDPLWEKFADICAGCGACAFVCPACHCFDINDEGSSEKGTRRKHWDACGFGKFTNHASGHNPRDVQNKRYRNRIMHKFKYYNDKFGKTLCTGCGRCVRACPVGIDIAGILAEIDAK